MIQVLARWRPVDFARAGGPALQDVFGVLNVNAWMRTTDELGQALKDLLVEGGVLTGFGSLVLAHVAQKTSFKNSPGDAAVLLARAACCKLALSCIETTEVSVDL